MYGLGLSVEEAVKTGVFIHGFSGDIAAGHKGEDGTTAQDLLDYLPHAVKKYREDYDYVVKDCCGSVYTVV
jgi:NAD(P)H-hydrate epimerase